MTEPLLRQVQHQPPAKRRGEIRRRPWAFLMHQPVTSSMTSEGGSLKTRARLERFRFWCSASMLSLNLHVTVCCLQTAQTDLYLLLNFYPRDAMLARVIVIATCVSVRPSVTHRYCVKTKKASDMISLPSGSPKTLVF